MGHAEKVGLLRHARAATLFPIEWEEPFGLVMLESMGLIVESSGEMPAALARIDRIDPDECRRHVETRFSPERMVAAYEHAYGSPSREPSLTRHSLRWALLPAGTQGFAPWSAALPVFRRVTGSG